jgi:spore coat polysaccharide biosynthesis protein SpsF
MTTTDVSAAVIIQARMGSTRFPGKSMQDLGGIPVIEWVVRRCRLASRIEEVIVATTTNSEDDRLVEHLDRLGVSSVRGSSEDVLGRYIDAMKTIGSTYVVRITGDCPFVQPGLIDIGVEQATTLDYVTTASDGRFPRGFDVEVIHRKALEVAAAEATEPVEREHVTPFIVWRPERFRSAPLPCPSWARHPDLRITLDEPADLEVLRRVVHELDATPESLRGEAVIELLLRRPDIAAINRNVEHRTVY